MKLLHQFSSSMIIILICLFFTSACQRNTSGNEDIKKTKHFEKLKSNEVLVYKMVGDLEKTLFLYVRSNRDGKVKDKEIGQWKNAMLWNGLQFSIDQKKCFFVVKEIKKIENEETVSYHFFVINGLKGTIIYHMDIFPNYRTSIDGSLLLYEDYYSNKKNKNPKIFFLYDIEKKVVIKKFAWEMNKNTFGWENIGGFNIIRKDNGEFKIYYPGEGNLILAASIIDSKALTFTELWNFQLPKGATQFPSMLEVEWQDDIIKQPTNPIFQK